MSCLLFDSTVYINTGGVAVPSAQTHANRLTQSPLRFLLLEQSIRGELGVIPIDEAANPARGDLDHSDI
jgi:hypothetical protein